MTTNTNPAGRKRGKRKSVKNSKTSPRIIARLKKISEAMDFRLQGYTEHQIGEEMGVPRSTVQKWLYAGIEDIKLEHAQDLIKLQVARIERLLQGYFANATNGDAVAAQIVIKLEERLSKLLGTDAPEKREISGPGGGPIAIQASLDFSDFEPEDRKTLRAMLVKYAKKKDPERAKDIPEAP